MKLAIISDTHFGDDNSQLAAIPQGKTDPEVGPKYAALVQAVGGQGANLDYLVLAGDILDFSVASYDKAYTVARAFFQRIRDDGIAKELVYLAGNHDADIWLSVQQQRHIINKIAGGQPPEEFRHSVAGIIDDRATSADRMLRLAGVSPRAYAAGLSGPRYGNMFLDAITVPATPFNFVYPNLYIVSENECALVTHGQYLEEYWAFLGEFANYVAHDDLKVGEIDVEELVELNFPLVQLACSGVGQAGAFTDNVVRPVQLDVKNKKLRRIEKYLKRFKEWVGEYAEDNAIKEWIYELAAGKAGDWLLDKLKSAESTRYSDTFLHDPKVRERFRNFYKSSLLEIGSLNEAGASLPAPWRVIFGHTHQPIAWNDKNAPKLDSVSSACPRRLTLHNTGGWLIDGGSFVGAEVFIYETDKGFSSTRV